MKNRILLSAGLFHSINDAATVTIPMIFPLLYSEQILIKNYSHIGILSNLGLLMTFFFQLLVASKAHHFEYKHMLLFSSLGIAISLFLLSLSWNFFSLILFYLLFRGFVSFYHPVGISMVSRAHPDKKIDFAMGIQSGSGNLGGLIAFISTGILAQSFGWKVPLWSWACVCLILGSLGFISVRKTTSKHEWKELKKIDLTAWIETAKEIKKYLFGFIFGGACWGTTVFYAPSYFNHKFDVPLSSTGFYLALWIVIGAIMTSIFGLISRLMGRRRLSLSSFLGASFFLILLGLSSSLPMSVVSLFFFGFFLFSIYPAFQSYVGNEVRSKNQILAFSIVANIQMLAGAMIVLIDGFLSDRFGIHTPFLFLAVLGIVVSVYYFSSGFGRVPVETN
jgi:MFS family permease